MNSELEDMICDILRDARQFVRWGPKPDFDNLETLRSWARKFERIPPAKLKKALDTLGGGENWPTLKDILNLCRQDMASSNQVLSQESVDIKLLKQFLQLPMMKELKKEKIGHFYKIQQDLILIARVGQPQVDLKILQKCIDSPQWAISFFGFPSKGSSS